MKSGVIEPKALCLILLNVLRPLFCALTLGYKTGSFMALCEICRIGTSLNCNKTRQS